MVFHMPAMQMTSSSTFTSSLRRDLQLCLGHIRLNLSKPELLVFPVDNVDIKIGTSSFAPTKAARHLGVMNDDHLISHCVASVSQSCHFASIQHQKYHAVTIPARHPAAVVTGAPTQCGGAASGGPECGRASGLQPPEASPRHPTADGAVKLPPFS